MKKQFILSALVVVTAAYQCAALQVDVTRVNGYYTYPGGEFSISSVNPSDPQFEGILGHYSSETIISDVYGTAFQTFCNSGTTEFQTGEPQSAILTSANVSLGAAWLYSQFAQGTLSQYDYSTTGSGGSGIFSSRAQAAYGLQNAIWALDGTGGFDLDTSAVGFSYYWGLATNMFGASATSAANGAYGVEELDLTYNGNVSQPMLVCVPDGGSTMILLGMALTGVGFLTRRLMRA